MSFIKICNRYLNDITWVNAPASTFSVNDTVDVWRINVSSNLSNINTFLAIMQPDEITRADRYFHTRDKNRFIISRGGLRNILGKYLNVEPCTIEFEIGINKKPYIKSTAYNNIYYNISHSGDWILLAISNSEIGADTELVNNTYSFNDILPGNFSTNEIDYINKNTSIERFFMLWTRKEALTKATGKGLDGDLKLIPCLDGAHITQSNAISSTDDWLISTFKLSENYFASVASGPKADKIRFLDIYF